MVKGVVFFLWFHARGTPEPTLWKKDVAVGVLFFVLVLVLRWQLDTVGIIRRSPLRGLLHILLMLLAIGLAGRIMNDTAKWLNGGKMPVIAQNKDFVETDAAHTMVSPATLFLCGTDTIPVDDSAIAFFLFPGCDYVSLGDLFIAAALITIWWVLIATVCLVPILLYAEIGERMDEQKSS